MDREPYSLFVHSGRTLMPECVTHFREPDETIPATIPGNNSDDICDLFAEAFTVQELYTRSTKSHVDEYEEYLKSVPTTNTTQSSYRPSFHTITEQDRAGSYSAATIERMGTDE